MTPLRCKTIPIVLDLVRFDSPDPAMTRHACPKAAEDCHIPRWPQLPRCDPTDVLSIPLYGTSPGQPNKKHPASPMKTILTLTVALAALPFAHAVSSAPVKAAASCCDGTCCADGSCSGDCCDGTCCAAACCTN